MSTLISRVELRGVSQQFFYERPVHRRANHQTIRRAEASEMSGKCQKSLPHRKRPEWFLLVKAAVSRGGAVHLGFILI